MPVLTLLTAFCKCSIKCKFACKSNLMIQRIQSLYLLLVALLTGVMLWLPLSVHSFSQGDVQLVMLNKLIGLADAGLTIDTGIIYLEITLVALVCGLSLITIFQFKNRKRQLVLCNATLVALSALVGVLFILVDFQLKKVAAGAVVQSTYLPAAYAPLFSLFLAYLAIRGIRKDDELVRSADRLR